MITMYIPTVEVDPKAGTFELTVHVVDLEPLDNLDEYMVLTPFAIPGGRAFVEGDTISQKTLSLLNARQDRRWALKAALYRRRQALLLARAEAKRLEAEINALEVAISP